MPKITVNGVEVDAPDGQNLIQVAKGMGIEIPHFCYHPGLGVDGNCRLCLIEVEGTPKPQIACNTFVREGLSVRTDTDRIKELRRAVLEFFFLNHPLDCPICDQSGECLLQDFYMRHGQYESRLDLPKVHKRKAVPVGARVTLDAERCVLCTRCVRFCDDVTGTGELRIVNRGHHSEITVHPGRPLDNPYSLNTVDLCPVGALTSSQFRFKCRVWFLETTRSICSGCSRGCNIHLEQSEGTIYRYRPRENQEVNRWWMCDDGRSSFHVFNESRCEAPLAGGEEIPHSEAIEKIIDAVRKARERDPAGIAMILSPEMSTESLYAARKFAREILGTDRVRAGSFAPPFVEDEILRKADPHPNRRGCEMLGIWTDDLGSELERGGPLAIVVQNDLAGPSPEAGKRLERFETVIALATNLDETTKRAALVHPVAPHPECDGTFVNFQGRVQRFRKAKPALGDALTVMELLRRIAAGLGTEFGWVNLNHVWKEMAVEVPELEGMSPTALGDHGLPIRSVREASGATVEKG
ncbi:MAG: 2Fe-2S iron-sulfur cluster binding domain-containing protein [Candidatus Eisenbacteria bacterium]|nr:2Fe-2S iron-sulfur cluster binding domain-containing protein [Candidatus Latescibacterota bacterium]MBD3303037.1 2Fe-2S iron-sulfur cluster binding domain-containing protein [Candidatus Eisenbacteria bacterium]